MKRSLVSILLLLLSEPAFSGSYLTSINFAQDENAINHPVLYVGSGGVRTIRVCLDPAISDIDLREPAVERAVVTWSGMTGANGNFSQDDLPDSKLDFESVLLHEMGHCLFGLAHPNLGGLAGSILEAHATASRPGANGEFDIDFGADLAPGSSDDLREDDINLFWFSIFDNYPFATPFQPVDQTTYSRLLSELPKGDSFAANANQFSGLAANPMAPDTEAVMNAIILPGDSKRSLQYDDIVTALYAASGLDETERTPDDYTVSIVYQGRTTDSCDVVVEDLGPDSPAPADVAAFCDVAAIAIGGADQHFRLAGLARIQISDEPDWYYQEIFDSGFESGDLSDWD